MTSAEAQPLKQSDNLLLNGLDRQVFARVSQSIASVELEPGQMLAGPYEPVQKVYFPYRGIISCVVELPGGGAIETGMIGRDGQWGASQALDDKVSLNNVVVQVAGRAGVLAVDRLTMLAREFPAFQSVLLRYDLFFTAEAQQTAACNAVHNVEQRLCKWLLRMHDLVGPDFPLTQDFMAQMMGVRRTSVTVIASGLSKAGIIAYARGKLQITDLERLRSHSCECAGELQGHFHRMFGPDTLQQRTNAQTKSP